MMKACIAIVGVLAMAASAVAGQFGCPSCQSCGGACVLKVEQVDDEETCYDVECKEICIPAVRFPWESCRTPKCGRTRIVSKLKEESRETKSCEYKWVLVCDRCGRPAGEKSSEGKNSVLPAPKPNSDNESSSPESSPMPPAAPPAAWMPSQPSSTFGGLESRPVITPRAAISGYSVRSRTR